MILRALICVLLLTSACPLAAQVADERTYEFEGYALSDSLKYSAETIDYYFGDRKIVLERNAGINYLGRVLKSNTVTYYQDYEYMEALGAVDSTGVLVDTPAFTDMSGETLNGTEIKYNLDTQQGLVLEGRTNYEEGFMTARIIKRISADTLFIADGTYTTCDDPDPHYYFYGKQMKFIMNDKLIIKPIVAYMRDIPVLWFPYYVFPIAKGRQSGFLMPRYGESREDGRYFSSIGYYFAPSDYYDYKISGTLRERNGWLLNNWVNYNVRDRLRGSIYGSFEDEPRNGTKQWRLTGSHSHTISPTFDIAGTVNLQSSEFSKYNSANLYQVLNRDMRSSIRTTKRWRSSGNSLIASLEQSKNLDSGDKSVTLPSLSFRMPNRLLFGGGGDTATVRKYAPKSERTDNDSEPEWYQNIYYTFNASFKNTETDRYSKSDAQRQLELLDPGLDRYDVHDFRSVKNLGIDTRLTSSHKLMGWLTANPSLSLRETFEATTDSVGYKRTDNASIGLDLSTKIYGTFNPAIGSLRGIRHVITPSINYNQGIRREYEGVDAEALYRFDLNDVDDPQTRRMSFSLRNLFQAKMVDGDQEKKIDLFALDFSSSLDFDQPSRRMSPLTTTLDVKPTGALKIIFRSTHDFYNSVDKFDALSPALTSLSVTTSLGFTDRNVGAAQHSSRVDANKSIGRDVFDTDIDDDIGGDSSSGTAGGRIPFNLQVQHFYSRTRTGKPGDYSFTERQTVKPTISFSPSEHFSVRYFMYYDINEKTLNDQRITINRDLHCWEASLYWVITGIRQGFYLKINIKDLPDVKIEQRRGVSQFTG